MLGILAVSTLAVAGWLEPVPSPGAEGYPELGPVGSGLGVHLDVAGSYAFGALSPSYATYRGDYAALFEYAEGLRGRIGLGFDLNETLDLVPYVSFQESVETFYSDARNAQSVSRGILQPHVGADLRVIHRRYPRARPYASIGVSALLTGDYDLVTGTGSVNFSPEEIRPGKPWWAIPGVRAGVGLDIRPRGDRSLTALYLEAAGTQLIYPYRIEEHEIFFEASRRNLVPSYQSLSLGAGLRLYPQIGRGRRGQLPEVL